MNGVEKTIVACFLILVAGMAVMVLVGAKHGKSKRDG